MTLDEFNEEPVREVKALTKKTPAVVLLSDADDDMDEVLPPNIFTSYIKGERCYTTITEDGRLVKVEDFNVKPRYFYD
jgi:hypothetical protein